MSNGGLPDVEYTIQAGLTVGISVSTGNEYQTRDKSFWRGTQTLRFEELTDLDGHTVIEHINYNRDGIPMSVNARIKYNAVDRGSLRKFNPAIINQDDDEDCPIMCGNKKILSILPCRHSFCCTCLRNWIASQVGQVHATCPLCREVIDLSQSDDNYHVNFVFHHGNDAPVVVQVPAVSNDAQGAAVEQQDEYHP